MDSREYIGDAKMGITVIGEDKVDRKHKTRLARLMMAIEWPFFFMMLSEMGLNREELLSAEMSHYLTVLERCGVEFSDDW